MTRREVVLGGLGLGVIGAAYGVRWAVLKRRAEKLAYADPHGGVNTAINTVSDQLETMEPARRLAYLLELADDPSPSQRFAAIEQLSDMDSPEAIDALAAAYYDSFSRVRQRALERLPDHDPARGMALLLNGLVDHDLWLRETASQQLLFRLVRNKPAPGTAHTLLAALDDSSWEVRITASNVLARFTGNHDPGFKLRHSMDRAASGPLRAKWEKWLDTHGFLKETAPAPAALFPRRMDDGPRYAFNTLDDRTVRSGDQAGKLTIVHFWGTWCEACHDEMLDLDRLHRELSARGVDCFGITVAESHGRDGVRKWVAKQKIGFPQAMGEPDVLEAFGDIGEVPVTFLIDGAGKIRYRWDGERDGATYRQAIEHTFANPSA